MSNCIRNRENIKNLTLSLPYYYVLFLFWQKVKFSKKLQARKYSEYKYRDIFILVMS